MALPALAGPLIAGMGTAFGGQVLKRVMPDADPNVNHGGKNMDGFSDGLGWKGALGMSGAGAAAGVMMGRNNAPEGANGAQKLMAGAMGGLKGAGMGFSSHQLNNAIQKDGGGLSAALWGAASNGLAASMKEGGPSVLQGALGGAGAGYAANWAHDLATDKGHGKIGDLVAGTAQGGVTGYMLQGDEKGAGIGAGLGAAMGGLNAFSTSREGDKAQAGSMSQAEQEMMASDGRANDMMARQQGGAQQMATMSPASTFNSQQSLPSPQQEKGDEGISL